MRHHSHHHQNKKEYLEFWQKREVYLEVGDTVKLPQVLPHHYSIGLGTRDVAS